MDAPTQLYQSKLDSKFPDKYRVLTPYTHRKTPLQVRCLIHNHEFEAVPQRLLAGTKNCPLCYKEKLTVSNQRTGARRRITEEWFYAKAASLGLTTDDVVRTNLESYQLIRACPDHGEFTQSVGNFYKGNSCLQCARRDNSLQYGEKHRERNSAVYLARCQEVHNNYYLYPHFEEEYGTNRSKVTILCPEHGEFRQRVQSHAAGQRCPKCAVTWSRGEREIYDWLASLGLEVRHHVRDLIPPQEVDLYLPEHQLAVEYQGLRYHSTDFLSDSRYHLKKLEACGAAGVQLIQVWEDEWRDRRPQIQALLRQRLRCWHRAPLEPAASRTR